MTYKFQIGLRPQWTLTSEGDAGPVPLQDMLALLAAIDASGNIAGACRACGLSYRHAWGVLRRFEGIFGTALLITNRRQGTQLSPFAQRLLWANRRIEARLMPTLESMASELQEELARLLPESGPHLRLHASHGFAVESLMQRMGGGAGLSCAIAPRSRRWPRWSGANATWPASRCRWASSRNPSWRAMPSGCTPTTTC